MKLSDWIEEAAGALDAARVIGERHGTPLNYGNLDRLIQTTPKVVEVPWCAEHDSKWSETGEDRCRLAVFADHAVKLWKPCRLEDPPRHIRLEG